MPAGRSTKRKAKKPNVGGRPTAYRKEYNEQARKLCLLGYTDKELSEFFGIRESTLNNWKKSKAGFLESIKAGKDVADANVADSLYQRAMGYEHAEDKIFQHEGKPLIVATVKHYPPDTQAASLFLRNRQPDKWRDKQDIEHTGKNGGPVQIQEVKRTIVDPKHTDS
jgi:hypothetical protein